MGEILLLTALVELFLTYTIYRTTVQPAVVFSGIWSFIVLTYVLAGEKYYAVTPEAFGILMLGMIVFPIGVYVASKYRLTKVNLKRKEFELRENVFLAMSGVAVMTLLLNDMVIIQNLLSGRSFLDLARLGIKSKENSGFQSYLMIYIVYPMVSIASPVCAARVFMKKSNWKMYLVINIALVALSALDHGGRIQVMNMMVSYVFTALVLRKKKKLNKKQKRWVLIFVVVAVLVVLLLSLSRGITDIGESAQLYFAGCIPHLVARLGDAEFSSIRTYGFLSLRGFIVPIVLIFQFFGLMRNMPDAYQLAERISVLIEEDAYIGMLDRTNAFLPFSYYFYIDFGFVGVVIGTFLYALLLGAVYRNMRRNCNERNLALYLFLITGVVLSFIRFPFKNYQAGMGLIYLFFIYRVIKKGRKKIK